MSTIKIDAFNVIGISIRTTNENNQSAVDIPALWSRFFTEDIASKIKNKISSDLYCLYTDYEKDYTKPYTTLLGYKVEHLDVIPEGLIGRRIPAQQYKVFNASGKLSDNSVFKEWTKIWSSDIDRAYSGDFEVYGSKSQDPENAEVAIFIALN